MERSIFKLLICLSIGVFLTSDLLAAGSSSGKAYKEYVRRLKTLNRQICPSSVRREYLQLKKEYQKYGSYLPTLSISQRRQVDHKTIFNHLPLLKSKLSWVKGEIKVLEKTPFQGKSVKKKRQRVIRSIQKELRRLLREKEKKVLMQSSSSQKNFNWDLSILTKLYRELFSQLSFLQNFSHPVDHFQNRRDFESWRQRWLLTQEIYAERKKNSLFFQRKIYEDGTLVDGRSDIYLRTALDTVEIKLQNNKFDRELVDDLFWVLEQVEFFLKKGQKAYLEAFRLWQKKIEHQIDFYESLLRGESADSQLAERRRSQKKLRQFVAERQSQVFVQVALWPEVYRRLFVFDQILLLEVGRATVENYRERQDVARVVNLRKELSRYNGLKKNQSLYKSLPKKLRQKNYSWLQLMFREGEFSFTHYFIPAVENTFCFDFYKTARQTRFKNVSLVLGLFSSGFDKKGFRATRYFSRRSMIGKISMDEMWSDYKRIGYQWGRRIRNTKKQTSYIQSKKHLYIDSYWKQGRRIDILQIGPRRYFVDRNQEEMIFYNYRDPDLFSFFEKVP